MRSKVLKTILLLPVLYVFGVQINGYFADWHPEEMTRLIIAGKATQPVIRDSVLHFTIWNVGYGGLGAESDFFFDDEGMFYSGSSMIRSPKALVEKNNAGAVAFLKKSTADFFLLQEVDVCSDRSYRIPQDELFAAALPDFAHTLATNYQCNRVPIPILQPWDVYGAVSSGLGTYSRFQPSLATRYQLPGTPPFPKSMFELDRCIAVSRYPTALGPELVVINVHNSAYDPGDKIKALQLPYLRDLAVGEFEKGNFVVLGGDWNQCPPNLRYDAFTNFKDHPFWQGNVPMDLFPEGWIFGYDPTAPTNRKTADPYQQGSTNEALIDFFVVSPNVQVVAVKGVDLDFQFSDHQPVEMTVRLR